MIVSAEGMATVVAVHQQDDVVDLGRILEDVEGVLQDRLAGHLEQLLGDVQADPGPGATGEDDGDGAQT